MLHFKLQPTLTISTIASLCGFGTIAGATTTIAEIMIGAAVFLLIAIQLTGWADHPPSDRMAHI
jgi:uncharacterized membrane protein YtjA (UPF0391 family)